MKPFFGLRAHDFGTLPAAELGAFVASSGAQCIQLALAKALPGEHLLPADFGEGGLASIRKALDDQGLKVAVLGCYIDMVTPDEAEREFSFRCFEEHLAATASLGCRIVGTETGSPEPYLHEPGGREKAFLLALDGLRRLIKTAEKEGVYLGLEAVAEYHAISSLAHMARVIDDLKSPALGVIFDPVNLVPPGGIADMDGFLDECFATLGQHIVALHVKDYRMEEGPEGPVKSAALPAGLGEVDWEGVFYRLMKAGKQEVPILLEEAGPADAAATFARMQQAWDRALARL